MREEKGLSGLSGPRNGRDPGWTTARTLGRIITDGLVHAFTGPGAGFVSRLFLLLFGFVHKRLGWGERNEMRSGYGRMSSPPPAPRKGTLGTFYLRGF